VSDPGGTTASGAATSLGVGRYLGLAAQAVLVVLVLRTFDLEPHGLGRIAMLVLGGFLIHSLLPMAWRLPSFVVLSLASLVVILGWIGAGWVFGVGSVLIALCHLPLPFGARVALLAATGVGLAVLRLEWVEAPWPIGIWAVLAVMFMFRLVVYLYDLRHESESFSLSRTLAFFFMLPSACFPLFPVVDYATFRDTYYDSDAVKIYQGGFVWILRGITHLLLYRLVYYNLTLAPSDVATAGDLVQFLITNILLYLRVSGQFHIIVGLLKLFGFNLPETNHFYFLASSFSEYWRRVNIYWKDFMMKVFYYPIYFAMRRRNPTSALVVATSSVFLVSWMLHSYQWFWIQGSFPIRSVDAAFWGIVGALVLVNSLLEAKQAKRRSLARPAWSPRRSAVQALRVVGTFSAICVLWSLWTSDTIADWLAMWSRAIQNPSISWVAAMPLLVLATAAAAGSHGGGSALLGRFAPGLRRGEFRASAAVTAAALLALLIAAVPSVYGSMGERTAGLVGELTESKLNRLDAERVELGYYEKLQQVHRFDSPLVEAGRAEPPVMVAEDELFRETSDFLWRVILPNRTSTYLGEEFRSNRWGMRDRDYEKAKPRQTSRIALLGSSHVMGHGVSNDEIFEALLEEQLNQAGPDSELKRYEILNFAAEGYTPPQQIAVLEKALEFDPDVVFFVAHSADPAWTIRHLGKVFLNDIEIPYPYLQAIVDEGRLNKKLRPRQTERRLKRQARPALDWVYSRIVERCRERGVRPIWIFMPKIKDYRGSSAAEYVEDAAVRAGFDVLTLKDVYSGRRDRTLQVSSLDLHPNAEAHRLVADRLFELLTAEPELLSSE